MYLFAYSTDMNVDELRKKVPSAKRVAIARLPGYVFTFTLSAQDQSTKANIIASTDADAVVWGVLIECDNNDRNCFNYGEDDLTPTQVTVFDEAGNTDKAEAFTAQPHAVNNFLLPYNWYLAEIITTARNAGLPDNYVNALSLLDSKVDPERES